LNNTKDFNLIYCDRKKVLHMNQIKWCIITSINEIW